MMKNKKLTYFLIAIVLGVWGLILYRIFDAVNATDDISIPGAAKQEKEVFNDFSIPKDTTKLLLNYRDPFGITKPKDTTIKISREISHKNISITPKPVMNWSFISYSGYIRNPSSKKLIALVSINGQNITLAEGETKNQVKLLKNLRDSIKIRYEGKTKFIVIKSAAL
jgi:hypothetical protein